MLIWLQLAFHLKASNLHRAAVASLLKVLRAASRVDERSIQGKATVKQPAKVMGQGTYQ